MSTTWPLRLNASPGITARHPSSCFADRTVCASSTRVCSPSPRTAKSTAGSAATSAATAVACGPPITLTTEGRASRARLAMAATSSIDGVMAVSLAIGIVDAAFERAMNARSIIASLATSLLVTWLALQIENGIPAILTGAVVGLWMLGALTIWQANRALSDGEVLDAAVRQSV